MSIDSASNFFVGSILYTLGIVVILAGITFINNIINKHWKPVKIWLPHYFEQPQRFVTEEEIRGQTIQGNNANNSKKSLANK